MRVVIIGGGIAGTTAAEEIRKRDPEAEITILSEEQHPLYSRVLLPHYLKGKVPRERVFLKKPEWYYEQKIDWQPGVRAEVIDTQNQFVQTSEGREIEYDKLLIAGGMDVRMILDEPRGVSYFRTVDDVDQLLALIQTASKDAKAVVYGGGFIACEYINAFVHHGMTPTVITRGPWFWSGVLGEASGTLVNAHLATHGVRLIPREEVVSCEETNGVLTAVQTRTERIEAEILGVGIGVTPDFTPLEGSGIETGKGIRTNALLETNIPNVYACGDGAEFYDDRAARHLVVGNWMNAQMQGRTVAKTILGESTAFDLVSSYATNVLGLELIFIGDTDRAAADTIEVRGAARDGEVAELFIRAGKLVGAVLVNKNSLRAQVTNAIKAGAAPDQI